MGASFHREKLETFAAGLVLVAAGVLVHVGRANDEARSPHQDVDCTNCHTAVASIADDGQMQVFDPSATCRNCHYRLDDMKSPSLTFHSNADRHCLDCHRFHSPDEMVVGERVFHVDVHRPAQRALCASCHGVGEDAGKLSDGHRAAAGFYHSDYKLLAGLSPSEACMICHSEELRVDMLVALPAGAIPRFSRHGNHPLGATVEPGAQLTGSQIRTSIDPDIHLFSGRIECQTCHTLSADTPYHLIKGTDQTTLCRKCHEMD